MISLNKYYPFAYLLGIPGFAKPKLLLFYRFVVRFLGKSRAIQIFTDYRVVISAFPHR